MPKLAGAGVMVALVVWSYFARPLYDASLIAGRRAADQWRERFSKPYATRPREAVVDANTEAAREIAAYLTDLSARGNVDAQAIRNGEKGRADLALRLKSSLAFPPAGLASTSPNILKDDALGEDDLTRYRALTIAVLPEVNTNGVLMLPKARTPGRRVPLVVVAQGRGGLPEERPDHRLPFLTHSARDLARGPLQEGYAVWMPVFVFYGRGLPDDLRERLSVQAQEAGVSLPAIEIAKTMRAIDVLSKRPEIDPDRIAMIGHSYGGFYTLYTAALDPRIKVAVVSAYLNRRDQVLDSSAPGGYLDWRFPSSLSAWRDPTIAALVCPRPLLIIAGQQDQLFPIAGAREAGQEVAAIYGQRGAADRFEFFESIARHDFNGEEASRFMRRFFGDP